MKMIVCSEYPGEMNFLAIKNFIKWSNSICKYLLVYKLHLIQVDETEHTLILHLMRRFSDKIKAQVS